MRDTIALGDGEYDLVVQTAIASILWRSYGVGWGVKRQECCVIKKYRYRLMESFIKRLWRSIITYRHLSIGQESGNTNKSRSVEYVKANGEVNEVNVV